MEHLWSIGLLFLKTKERTQARPLLRICEIIWRRLTGFLQREARQEDGRKNTILNWSLKNSLLFLNIDHGLIEPIVPSGGWFK